MKVLDRVDGEAEMAPAYQRAGRNRNGLKILPGLGSSGGLQSDEAKLFGDEDCSNPFGLFRKTDKQVLKALYAGLRCTGKVGRLSQ
jgi:hypothetical protein